jgi:uncharacterized protein (TIGR00252 family)
MTHVAIGHEAEQAAAEHLVRQGYEILQQNWRTRYCEIDVIARKDKTIFFVEVKYRATNQQGTGLDYITPPKLRQMMFAAEMWVQEHNWQGEYCLAAAEVAGPAFAVTDFIEIT